MKCPKDNNELIEAKLEEKSCWRCPVCQGYFIGLAGTRLKGVELSRLRPKSTPCVMPLGEDPLISPSSGKAMKHFIYRKVGLDYCKSSNSVWMDSGELDSITEQATNRKKKKATSSGYDAGDLVGEGVFGFIEVAIGGLFDAL